MTKIECIHCDGIACLVRREVSETSSTNIDFLMDIADSYSDCQLDLAEIISQFYRPASSSPDAKRHGKQKTFKSYLTAKDAITDPVIFIATIADSQGYVKEHWPLLQQVFETRLDLPLIATKPERIAYRKNGRRILSPLGEREATNKALNFIDRAAKAWRSANTTLQSGYVYTYDE